MVPVNGMAVRRGKISERGFVAAVKLFDHHATGRNGIIQNCVNFIDFGIFSGKDRSCFKRESPIAPSNTRNLNVLPNVVADMNVNVRSTSREVMRGSPEEDHL